MPLSAPEYWLEWTKNYFRCQFTHVGELIHKETWSAASFGWAEGLQMINPPIYRLTTAVSDIDQTNINRDIRDGNWLSTLVMLNLIPSQTSLNFHYCTLWKKILSVVFTVSDLNFHMILNIANHQSDIFCKKFLWIWENLKTAEQSLKKTKFRQ